MNRPDEKWKQIFCLSTAQLWLILFYGFLIKFYKFVIWQKCFFFRDKNFVDVEKGEEENHWLVMSR